MQFPSIPASEERRLATLHALGLLDTLPEARFDAITRVAARLFNMPIALISLVDGDRQWFKSRVGLSATQTPRQVSFCGHAINSDKIFLVSDASSDARFIDNPLVLEEPSIRFYAGRPLAAPNGEKLGTLCIIDRNPRVLNAPDLALLDELGSWAEAEIALLWHCHSVNAFLDRLLEQVSEPVLLADDDGKVRFANIAAQRLLKYVAEDIAGLPLLKLLPEKDRLRFEVEAAALQRAASGFASLEYAGAVRRRDGAEVRVTIAFFRTVAAGRGVTAVVLRPD
jgi:PAS domain S-box-containing protein